MNDLKVASELLTLARTLTADGGRGQFMDVVKGVESLRSKFAPTADEAIFWQL